MLFSRTEFLAGIAGIVAYRPAQSGSRTGQFHVYWRPSGAVYPGAVAVAGHVGFAYELDGYEFMAGSVENAHSNITPKGKDFWYRSTPNPLLAMGASDNIHARPPYATRYDFYKSVAVSPCYPDKARDALRQIAASYFVAPGKDCLDAVRQVFKDYGGSLTAAADRMLQPNDFFKAFPGKTTEILVPWPGATLDVSLYVGENREGIRDDLLMTSSGAAVYDNLSPDMPPTGVSAPIPTYRSSVAVRSGYVALYSRPDCDPSGDFSFLKPGDSKNVKDLGWSDSELRSYFASAESFDPKKPPLSRASSRFGSAMARLYYDRSLDLIP